MIKILENIVTHKQISKLLDFFDAYKDLYTTKDGCEKLFLTSLDEDFDKLNEEILSPIFGPNEHTSMFMKRTRPSAIHTDGRLNSLPLKRNLFKINYVLLIPLEITPATSEAYTVYFNQYDDSPNELISVYQRSEIWKGNVGKVSRLVTNYSELRNYTEEKIDSKYSKYLSERDQTHLIGLSVQEIVKWKLGNGMMALPIQLHCGGDYKNYKLIQKKAILYTVNAPHLVEGL